MFLCTTQKNDSLFANCFGHVSMVNLESWFLIEDESWVINCWYPGNSETWRHTSFFFRRVEKGNYGNTGRSWVIRFRKLIRQGDARAALEVAQEIRRLAKDLGKSSKEVPCFDENLVGYTTPLPHSPIEIRPFRQALLPDGELAFGGVPLNDTIASKNQTKNRVKVRWSRFWIGDVLLEYRTRLTGYHAHDT